LKLNKKSKEFVRDLKMLQGIADKATDVGVKTDFTQKTGNPGRAK
jgi:hypothetical protein